MGLLDFIFGPPSRTKFAADFIALMKVSGEKRPLQFIPADFTIVSDVKEAKLTISLHNIYQEYCATPRAHRAATLQHFVRSQFQGSFERTFDEVKGMLLPRIRERSYYEIMRMKFKREFANRSLAESYAVGIVVDLPDSIQESDERQFDTWKITFEEALAIARKNLWDRSNEDFIQPLPGFYRSPWIDSHDCSRLFLHDLIWQLKVKGAHVAMAPNRDTLLVTGADDDAGLALMAKVAGDAMSKPRFMSAMAVKLNDRTWEPWLPPAGHASYNAFKMLALQTEIRDYEEQGAMLKEQYAKSGEEIFVAKFMALQRPDGTAYSMCTWTKAVESGLLPKTDDVIFCDVDLGKENSIVAKASWDHVMSVAGDLLKPMGMYPERYRVNSFPMPEQIQRLKTPA